MLFSPQNQACNVMFRSGLPVHISVEDIVIKAMRTPASLQTKLFITNLNH